jgi:hypothetical protein
MLGLIAFNEVGVGDGINILNLLVDTLVGFFTVWGLYWAASEFAESARKPDLRLLPGRYKSEQFRGLELDHPDVTGNSYCFMSSPPFRIRGWPVGDTPDASLVYSGFMLLGLFLENQEPKAGRYVRVVLRVHATPAPSLCEFRHSSLMPDHSPIRIQGERDASLGHIIVPVQLADHVVVYQSPPIFMGTLHMRWDPSHTRLPKTIVIDYVTHTLDGTCHTKMKLLVEWRGPPPLGERGDTERVGSHQGG